MFVETLLNKNIHVQYFVGNEKIEVIGHLAGEDINFIYLQERNQFIKISSIVSIYEDEDLKVKGKTSRKKTPSEPSEIAKGDIDKNTKYVTPVVTNINAENLVPQTTNEEIVKPKSNRGRRKLTVSVAQHSVALTDGNGIVPKASMQTTQEVASENEATVKKSPDGFSIIKKGSQIQNKNTESKVSNLNSYETTARENTQIPSFASTTADDERRHKEAEAAIAALKRHDEALSKEQQKHHVPTTVDLITNSPASFTMIQCSTNVRKAESKRKKALEEALKEERRKEEEARKALEEESKKKKHVASMVNLMTNSPSSFTAIRSPENIRKDEEKKQREHALEEEKLRELEKQQQELEAQKEREKPHQPKVVSLIKSEPMNFAIHRNRISELVKAASRALVNPLSDDRIPQKVTDPMDEEFDHNLGTFVHPVASSKKLTSQNTPVAVARPLEQDNSNISSKFETENSSDIQAQMAEDAVKRIFGHSSALLRNRKKTVNFAPVVTYTFKSNSKKN